MIPAQLYIYIYTIIIGIVAMSYYGVLTQKSANGLLNKSIGGNSFIVVLYIIVALFIGFRPISGIFTDMLLYSSMYYDNIMTDHNDIGIWWLASFCKSWNLESSVWFTIISFIYFGAYLKASMNLSKNNGGLIFVTFLMAFSTFAYATNTIRCGMATSIAILAMSYYLLNGKSNKIIAYILFVCSIITHKSSALPIVCFIISYYKVDAKKSMLFWLLSVVLSLVMGNSISSIFENLGFDDRMDKYLQATDMTGFAYVGFRWDFLLYSIMPILLAYYIIIKKKIRDKKYETLISAYILSNAFWVMIIRAQFSDRFAYLSWFMYPIVIAYPFLKLNIFGTMQAKIAKRVFFAHLGFTLFMVFVFYA